jgi:hypothetical protein
MPLHKLRVHLAFQAGGGSAERDAAVSLGKLFDRSRQRVAVPTLQVFLILVREGVPSPPLKLFQNRFSHHRPLLYRTWFI